MNDLLWKRQLSMGDEVAAYTDRIEIGPVSIRLGRPVERKDLDDVCTIYAMGMAARGRYMAVLAQQIINCIQPVNICGYKDPESDMTEGQAEDLDDIGG